MAHSSNLAHTISVNKVYWNIVLPIIYILSMAAFTLQWQSLVVATEII